MNSGSKKIYSGGAVILLILLSVGLVSSQPKKISLDKANDKCVFCHVDTYESASRSRYPHVPFVKRQCVTCHLRDGAGTLLHSGEQEETYITGSLVSQDPLWAKQFNYPGSTVKTMEHSIDLGNLVPEKHYRFRVVLSETEEESASKALMMKSHWFGLLPKEVAAASTQSIACAADLSAFPEKMAFSPNIYCPTGTSIIVSWQTKIRMFAWLELQALDGIGLEQLTGVADQGAEPVNREGELTARLHDLRRDPEDLAIDVCRSCHPDVNLVLSHPVRIYASNSDRIKIPAAMPTVNGMLTCATCHNPHGSDGKKLIRTPVKTQLCVSCHIDFKNTSLGTMFDS